MGYGIGGSCGVGGFIIFRIMGRGVVATMHIRGECSYMCEYMTGQI